MNTNIPPQKNYLESHFRKIYYNIKDIGSYVEIKMKNIKYRNIKMSEMTHRRFFILVDLKVVDSVPNVVFYNEFGKRMGHQDLEETKNAYVLLAMAKKTTNYKIHMYILRKQIWISQTSCGSTR